MAKRKFDKLNDGEKMLRLLRCIDFALQDDPSIWRTDIWEIAKQFGTRHGIRKEDFDLIRNLTIEQVVEIIALQKNQ